MKKLLILIVIIIIVLAVVYINGDKTVDVNLPSGAPDTTNQANESSSSASATPSSQQSPNTTSGGSSPSSTVSGDADLSVDLSNVLREAQTYTNKTYGYSINLHEWWWYSYYGDVDDENVASLIAFDRNKLDDRSYTEAAIVLEHRTDDDIDSSNYLIVKKDGDQTYVLRYQYKNDDYREIFKAMADSMKFEN